MSQPRPRLLAVFGEHAYGDPARGPGYEYTNFLPAFRRLGYEVTLFDSFARAPYRDFAELNRRFLEVVQRENPDIIFCVLSGYELWSETLELVRDGCRAALVHWATDDSWKYEQFSRFVAPPFDVYATTYPEALAKSRRDGHDNFRLSQWAADAAGLAEPLPAGQCRYPASFVGAAYGNRPRRIDALRRRGIEVACFGHGWPNGPVATLELQEIIRSSVVSLNFGDSGIHLKGLKPYRSRQIKARIFEVPGAGGLLATEETEHLGDYLRPGEEIVVFRDADDLAQKIRQLLDHPAERDRIARAGHRRVRAEHTYDRRFESLFEQAQTAAAERRPTGELDRSAFEVAVERHRVGPGLEQLRKTLTAPLRLICGPRRGPRAARRLLFELSWRLAGAHTYSAAGWPGRLFYRES